MNVNVIARGMNKLSTQESHTDTKSKNRALKNTNDKSSSTHVQKVSSSVRIDFNKREIMNSTVCHSNASVLNTKTVNAVNDSSNIVCVSCGKDLFMLSYEKCVARYAFSIDSTVKRALFTTPVAIKYKNLGATSVVVKSRLSVAKTLTTTNKVSSALSLSSDSSRSRTLSKYMKNKIATSQKWQKWFKYQSCFNWSPKSKTAQSPPSVSKSSTSVRTKFKTSVTTQIWVAKLSTLPSALGSCDAVYFGNDHFAAITGYGDYVQGNLMICHVYYVEGLGHNLFSITQFCDKDLEVAFRSNTCYVRNLEGDDLLTSFHDLNLYTISIFKLAASYPVSDEEPKAPAEAPPSADYVLRPEHPPSPDYVSGPEHPLLPDYVPGPEEPDQASLSLDYVPEPEYPEYLAPYEVESPMEDQPLPDDASPAALSPGYIVDSDLEEDPEEDPKEDPVDYYIDGGDDDDDESYDVDVDDEQKASEDDEEEEEKHPALVDSSAIPVDDLVPLAEDIKAFKTDESAPMKDM
nr:integrase, catalytic region, zinc finger, CCHC-type, peptidase aspartic, catalytic [Tanacetum cinerariifolium]